MPTHAWLQLKTHFTFLTYRCMAKGVSNFCSCWRRLNYKATAPFSLICVIELAQVSSLEWTHSVSALKMCTVCRFSPARLGNWWTYSQRSQFGFQLVPLSLLTFTSPSVRAPPINQRWVMGRQILLNWAINVVPIHLLGCPLTDEVIIRFWRRTGRKEGTLHAEEPNV